MREAPLPRVVTVASNAHSTGRIDFDDLQGERSYSGSRAYSQSKLANVLFSAELAGRTADTPLIANSLHPGVVNTSFGAEDPGLVQRILVPVIRPFLKTVTQGAATSIRVASDPALSGVSGCYFANGRPAESSDASHDPTAATRLWQLSAELVGLADTV